MTHPHKDPCTMACHYLPKEEPTAITHPNPKDVEAWMLSLGFTSSLFHWRLPLKDLIVSPEEATFFYTIHHTALTSFRDEVLADVIGADKPNLNGAPLTNYMNRIKREQRKAIQTISRKYLI